MTNVWEFVKEQKISCSKIFFKMYSTTAKILQVKLWVYLTASVIPAALKPFLITSGCLQRYSYTSACGGLSSEREREKERERKRANDTLTSAGFISLTSCCVTSSANQALYLLAINYLVGLLTIFHRGWNLFVWLCGMITIWQKFFIHKCKRWR